MKNKPKMEFELVKYLNIIIEGNVLYVYQRDSQLYKTEFEQFVIILPSIIKYQYMYVSGCLKIIPNQSIRIELKDDHIIISPAKGM